MIDQQDSKYSIGVIWDKKTGCEVHIDDFPPLNVDMPIMFGGGRRYPCPHELLFSALGSCFLGTFLVFQRQLRLELQDLQISVGGSVDLIRRGKYRGKYAITGIDLFVHVKIDDDEDEKEIVNDCIRLTKEHCPVNRALHKSVPITVQSKIETTQG